MGHQNITCSSQELVTLNPPSGLACGDYMQIYITIFGGYLINPAATDSCVFCSSRTTDAFLESVFNMEYSHRLRNFWIILGYIAFNVSLRHPAIVSSKSCVCRLVAFTVLRICFTFVLATSWYPSRNVSFRKSQWFTTRPDEEMQLEDAALFLSPYGEHEAMDY